MTTAASSTITVKQTRSTIGEPKGMELTLKGLGLRGLGSTVTVKNTPSFRGAIKKVLHMVTIVEKA